MQWMRTDYSFDHNGAVLVFGERELRCLPMQIVSTLRDACVIQNPDLIQSVVKKLILQFRPELAGMVIIFMGFDAYRQTWEFSVLHERLPATSPMHTLPKMWLDPKKEQEQPYEQPYGFTKVSEAQGEVGEVQTGEGTGSGSVGSTQEAAP